MSAQLAHLILAKAETQFPTLTPRALPCEGVAPVQMRRAITFERAIAAVCASRHWVFDERYNARRSGSRISTAALSVVDCGIVAKSRNLPGCSQMSVRFKVNETFGSRAISLVTFEVETIAI